VEANSLRVLSRVFGYRGDPREGEGKAWVWKAAESVIPENRAGDFNQALMELGSQLCTISKPLCNNCPIAGHCVARLEGLQEQIPPPKKKQQITEVSEVGVVIRRGKRVLLCRRPVNAGRWQNMWEVPHAERTAGEELAKSVARVAKELTGLTVNPGRELLTIRHGVTRYRITLTVLEAKVQKGKFVPGFYTEAKWLTPSELAAYPVSSPQRKLMRSLGESHPT
jgi:A/G-specific adenine glycosylase